MELSNCYDLLNIHRTATVEQIKKAFRKAALIHHPDKGGEPEQFRKISKALDTLADAKRRTTYDQHLSVMNSMDGLRVETKEEKKKSARKMQKASTTHTANNLTEIPSNPGSLSVKELKNLLNNLGIRHDDCVEKTELLSKLRERKTAPAPPKRHQTTNHPQPPPPSASDSLSIKVLSIGDPECGKSCVIKRYCEGRFISRYISTIGLDYGVKKMTVAGRKVSINFFDLSGQKDYVQVRQDFYKDSQGVIITFELNDAKTFANIVRWEREAKANGLSLPDVDVIVCGNKADLTPKEVNSAEASKFANSRGFKYFEVSANTGLGVAEALDFLFQKVVRRVVSNKENLLKTLNL